MHLYEQLLAPSDMICTCYRCCCTIIGDVYRCLHVFIIIVVVVAAAVVGRRSDPEEREKLEEVSAMHRRRHQATSSRALDLRLPDSRPHQGKNSTSLSSGSRSRLSIRFT